MFRLCWCSGGQKLIAPLVEAEEYEPDAASEATGKSSGGSIEECPAFEPVGLKAEWSTVGCAACAAAVVGSLAELEQQATIAVVTVVEVEAVADELAAAEVEVCAWAPGRVVVPVEGAQVVAVGGEQVETGSVGGATAAVVEGAAALDEDIMRVLDGMEDSKRRTADLLLDRLGSESDRVQSIRRYRKLWTESAEGQKTW